MNAPIHKYEGWGILFGTETGENTEPKITKPCIIGMDNIPALIMCIGISTTVNKSKYKLVPVYSCGCISEVLSKLTGRAIDDD